MDLQQLPLATTSSLCHKEKYTPRDMASPCIYQNGIYGCRDYHQPQGEDTPRDMASMYISEWDLRGAVLEKYTPRDMAFLHVSKWIYTVLRSLQLVPQGRNIHPGMAFLHMYISEWIYTPLLLLAASPGSIYTRDMAFLAAYRMGSKRYAATINYQQLATSGEIYTQGWHSSMYISEWDLHGAATSTQQLVPQGRNIHPGTWHSPCISEWDLHGALATTSSLCHKGEIYTQGHGIPPCIYQNGIYTVPPTTSSLCHKEKYTPRNMASSMYISEWDPRAAATSMSDYTNTSSFSH
jgi:hypothetical protein